MIYPTYPFLEKTHCDRSATGLWDFLRACNWLQFSLVVGLLPVQQPDFKSIPICSLSACSISSHTLSLVSQSDNQLRYFPYVYPPSSLCPLPIPNPLGSLWPMMTCAEGHKTAPKAIPKTSWLLLTWLPPSRYIVVIGGGSTFALHLSINLTWKFDDNSLPLNIPVHHSTDIFAIVLINEQSIT